MFPREKKRVEFRSSRVCGLLDRWSLSEYVITLKESSPPPPQGSKPCLAWVFTPSLELILCKHSFCLSDWIECIISPILTMNVPFVYMARDVMILMRANPFRRPLEGVGPENFDIFGRKMSISNWRSNSLHYTVWYSIYVDFRHTSIHPTIWRGASDHGLEKTHFQKILECFTVDKICFVSYQSFNHGTSWT